MFKKLVCLIILMALANSALAGTVAYWRFDDMDDPDILIWGPVAPGHPLPDSDGWTVWRKAAHDWSGNGNHLTTWDYSWAGFIWQADVPAPTVPLTGASNVLSIQNAGSWPASMTWSAQSLPSGIDIETISPAEFTVEASFRAEFGPGGYHTIVGRDGMNVWTGHPEWAPFYFSVRPDMQVAVEFTDVSGYNHVAESPPGLVTTGQWYNMVGVSDGETLSLYLNNVLVDQNDFTDSGSGDTRLAIGYGAGGDWQAGTWSVGRGLWNGEHRDRWYGYIDEVRISNAALSPPEFLCFSWKPYKRVPLGPNDFKGVPDYNDPDAAKIWEGWRLTRTAGGTMYPPGTHPKYPNDSNYIYEPNVPPKFEAGYDPNKSWSKYPHDPNITDHEQGHLDQEEIDIRKAQADIDKEVKDGTLKGFGKSKSDAKKDFNKKVQDKIDKWRDKNQEKYDRDTKQGTDPQKQKEARDRQKKELEETNKDPAKKKGPDAKSSSKHSCTYNLGFGLTFENTIIVDVPDPDDPIIGAELIMPVFYLVGQTVDGEFWFRAEADSSTVEIQKDGQTYLNTQMDYITYSPAENMFYGLGMGFWSDMPEGISAYVDGVCQALMSKNTLTLYGVEIYPDANFMSLTNGFTVSADCPASIDSGMRIVGSGLEADLNEDYRVDFKDFAILANQWFQDSGYPSADISPPGGDGVVNFEDLSLFADHWLEGVI
jgi:hypothetical protein